MRFKSYLDTQRDEHHDRIKRYVYAERIGVHPATITRLLDGRLPTPDVMFRIFVESKGKVRPIDWYPKIREASAEMRRGLRRGGSK